MASNTGAVATEPPPSTNPAHPSAIAAEDFARVLKRHREPDSPVHSADGSHPDILGSPIKSARLALATATAHSAAPLTGAAALEDERRRREEEQAASPPATSDNPGQKAIASLMSGVTQVMSRPADAPQPAPTAAMEPLSRVGQILSSIHPNNVVHAEDRGQTSPQSTASLGGAPVTESPTPMDVDAKGETQLASQQVAGQEERLQPGSLSYPGSLQSNANLPETPARGMSFPMPSQGQTSPTSGTKKHKCPYCNTEFTRHHNLKSHLLTHSQEKPFLCTDCQMRFRRLHDLKRHGKLHSGEKPHICPKCDRKFARGDALARHSKGAGGCAGRRSSMGSFADGDELEGLEGDESNMSGIAYDNGDEEELRRQSVPGVNAQQVAGGAGENYGAHSRTYPPTGPRPSTSGLYPPNVGQPQGSAGAAASGSGPKPTTSAGGSLYSQAGMTESPKPLSPGVQGHESANMARQRSPSLSQQVQQQQFGRRQSEIQPRPKLPGLSHPGFAAPSTGPGSFPQGRGTGGSQAASDSGNMFAQSDPTVWAYIQGLEEKVKSLSDKVLSLDHEVVNLKQQLDAREGPGAA